MFYWVIRTSYYALFFFFSSRRRHTRLTCDWSSDVCSSDLHHGAGQRSHGRERLGNDPLRLRGRVPARVAGPRRERVPRAVQRQRGSPAPVGRGSPAQCDPHPVRRAWLCVVLAVACDEVTGPPLAVCRATTQPLVLSVGAYT